MPVTRRARTLEVAPQRLWEVVADPHHLPRWWPRVQRVEGVHGGAFTVVMLTDRGRVVRADHRIVESDPARRCTWAQDVHGTPFASILREAYTTVELAPGERGTRVVVELRQSLRGMARLGSFMVRRAARNQLDAALDGLERILA
ncbi:MAG: hypothetical protein E6G56_01010 [Actinobacteria bacterium]|nr:MAG: hypothetical protein E6G56_01010 [Actinomycetota bacterium]